MAFKIVASIVANGSDVSGYTTEEYFDGDVLGQTFATAREAEDAAKSAYRGTDKHGVGVSWEIVEAERSYTVKTDAFEWTDDAKTLDEAIGNAFAGEIKGIHDEESLREKFARYVADGGWCWIDEDGVRVLEIGRCGCI